MVTGPIAFAFTATVDQELAHSVRAKVGDCNGLHVDTAYLFAARKSRVDRRMDYDLAESLMDAGFPQLGKGSLIGPLNKLVWRSGDRVYVPTLEELIEACGESFGSLEKQNGGWLASANYDQNCFAKRSRRPLMARASKTIE